MTDQTPDFKPSGRTGSAGGAPPAVQHKAVQHKTELHPGTLLCPVPVVMVTSGADGYAELRPNIVTVAWAGTVNSDPPMVSISLRPERHSHDAILKTGECVINLVHRELAEACDFCGVRSGRDVDKFEVCDLTPVPMPTMTTAPAIAESPLNLACKVRSHQRLGSHTLILLEITAVTVSDALLDEAGGLHLERARLVAYNHGQYTPLGAPIGFFGYAVAAPDIRKRRLQALEISRLAGTGPQSITQSAAKQPLEGPLRQPGRKPPKDRRLNGKRPRRKSDT